MQFGPCPVERAAGAILAHSLRAGGRLFKKGRALTADDIGALRDAGLANVTVARLEAGDIAEDEAATRIAKACAGNGARIAAAFTGRANLYAEADGLALVDADRIRAANAIDQAVTLATLAPYTRVSARQMLATIKIIPYAAPAAAVEAAERALTGGAIAVAPFKPHRAALILTSLPDTKPSLLDKSSSGLNTRVKSLGSEIALEKRVPHETGAIAAALGEAKAAGCDLILVFGPSAITDRRDIVPAAIERAGGSVTHFGMPVDPGNLLLMGKLGDADVVGLPGCARSPKLNGFDFVLWRLLADLPVGTSELSAMGVGGLLAEIGGRPQPREEQPAEAPHAPRIGAVVLAAGLSSRMGRNKLLEDIGGKPLVRRVVEAAQASAADPVVVVTGSDTEAVSKALDGLLIGIVENDAYAMGLSESLKRGLKTLPQNCDGALVLLGDMPDVSVALIDRLIAAFDPAEGRAICVATHGGRRGNPVLWARRFFPEMLALEGDVGAKSLMGLYDDLVREVEAPDDAPLVDLDTAEALAAYKERAR